MPDPCTFCEGSGLQVAIAKNGDRLAHECSCQLAIRIQRKLDRSGVPARFRGATLSNFEPGDNTSLYQAKEAARRFVDTYPYKLEGVGLVLTGRSGLGKTHLAAAMLQSLILEKRVRGLFFDWQELLKLVQNSYNPSVAATELSLLQPVFDAEILVLDDLGSTKPTPWVWDTVFHILNSRYNRDRSTIITTNFANKPAVKYVEAHQNAEPIDDNNQLALARLANARETLGDRVGERMLSRLQEMCVFIQLKGKDKRQSEKRAHFPEI